MADDMKLLPDADRKFTMNFGPQPPAAHGLVYFVLSAVFALALTGCETTPYTSTTSPQFAARCMAAAKLIQPIVQTNDIPEAAPMELYEAVEKHWLDLVSSRASDTEAALNYSGQAIEALSIELEDGGQPAFEQARGILQACEASTQGEGA